MDERLIIGIPIVLVVLLIFYITIKIKNYKISKLVKMERAYTLPTDSILQIPYMKNIFKSEVFILTPREGIKYECTEIEYYSGRVDIFIVGMAEHAMFKVFLRDTSPMHVLPISKIDEDDLDELADKYTQNYDYSDNYDDHYDD